MWTQICFQGEAQYVKDIPPEFGELQGVFVLSSEANADIERIDASQALVCFK